jgi:hypothetical protein
MTVVRTTRVLLWALLALFVLVVGSAFFVVGVICGTGEALARVRSLDDAQLERLHEAMRELNQKFGGSEVRLAGEKIPEELAFLQANGVVLSGEMSRINVAGCVDDFVILRFHGLESGSRKITLIPGEVQPQEVLWSEAESHGW